MNFFQEVRQLVTTQTQPFRQICYLTTSKVNGRSSNDLGQWTDCNGDHGMRKAHSIGSRQHHALLIVWLVAVVKQCRKKGNNSSSITNRNKPPHLLGARAQNFYSSKRQPRGNRRQWNTTAMQEASINCSAPQQSQ
jgi:hypothetical protein